MPTYREKCLIFRSSIVEQMNQCSLFLNLDFGSVFTRHVFLESFKFLYVVSSHKVPLIRESDAGNEQEYPELLFAECLHVVEDEHVRELPSNLYQHIAQRIASTTAPRSAQTQRHSSPSQRDHFPEDTCQVQFLQYFPLLQDSTALRLLGPWPQTSKQNLGCYFIPFALIKKLSVYCEKSSFLKCVQQL